MQYQSKTKQWSPDQLRQIQDWPADKLIEALSQVSPVVALRAIAEVMLNEDEEKLRLLLADDNFTALWRQYKSDYGLDDRDDEYAQKLEEKLLQMK